MRQGEGTGQLKKQKPSCNERDRNVRCFSITFRIPFFYLFKKGYVAHLSMGGLYAKSKKICFVVFFTLKGY